MHGIGSYAFLLPLGHDVNVILGLFINIEFYLGHLQWTDHFDIYSALFGKALAPGMRFPFGLCCMGQIITTNQSVHRSLSRDFITNYSPLSQREGGFNMVHDDFMARKRFPNYWPFVRGIHVWHVDSLHKGLAMCSFDIFLVVSKLVVEHNVEFTVIGDTTVFII